MRVVCLTTPVEDPARHAAALAHHQEVGLTAANGFDVRFAYGLHKTTSGLTTEHLYMVDRPEADAEPYTIGKHPVNIWLGHYMIWNALRLSDDPFWMVIECDAQFQSGWIERYWRAREEALHLFRTGTMWDLIYLGSCCTTGRQKTQLRGSLYQIHGTAPQCNHAYLVTRSAAEILCATLRKVWAPIDIQQASECWGNPLPRAVEMVAPPVRPLVVYTVLPRLVDQFNTEIGA